MSGQVPQRRSNAQFECREVAGIPRRVGSVIARLGQAASVHLRNAALVGRRFLSQAALSDGFESDAVSGPLGGGGCELGSGRLLFDACFASA